MGKACLLCFVEQDSWWWTGVITDWRPLFCRDCWWHNAKEHGGLLVWEATTDAARVQTINTGYSKYAANAGYSSLFLFKDKLN